MNASADKRRLAGIIGLLALQGVVIAWRCRAFCMYLDDFLNFELYRDVGFNWGYLTRNVFGQVAPGYRLVQAVYLDLFGVTYTPALLILGGLSLAITLFVILIAERARVDRGVIFAGALVHAFLLPYMQSQSWWSTALHTIPSTAAWMASLWCLVGPDGNGSTRRGRWWAAILFGIALAFTAKALFAPILMAGVVAWFRRTHGSSWRETVRATAGDFLGFVPFALVYGVLVVLYGPKENPPAPTLAVGILFVWKALSDGTIASTLGLPVVIALLVTATFAFLAIRRRPNIALVWIAFIVYVVVAMGVVARMRGMFGAEAGRTLRYHCEGATFFLLTLLLSAAGFAVHSWSRAAIALAALLTAVNLQLHSAGVIDLSLWDIPHTCDYVRNLEADLKSLEHRSDVYVLDATVPSAIEIEWMAPYNVMSRFLTIFTRLPVVSGDRANYQVTDDGHVRHR